METCKQCGKELTTTPKLKMGLLNQDLCSQECKGKYQKTEKENKGKVKEIKNKCNQCGKVWHYLESDVSQLRARGVANAMGGCGTCCNPFSFYMLNKANEAGDKIKEMQRCPNCKSSDVTKKTVYHDKK